MRQVPDETSLQVAVPGDRGRQEANLDAAVRRVRRQTQGDQLYAAADSMVAVALTPPAVTLTGSATKAPPAMLATDGAGTPTDFDLLAGISVGVPILTLPTKIHLTNGNPVDFGPSCFIGSDMDPMVLHPANIDISNAMLSFESFNPDGTPNPSGILASLVVSGTIQGESTFAVPGSQGCQGLEAVINAVVGLPSPSGANSLVLEDASSALVLPNVPPDRAR